MTTPASSRSASSRVPPGAGAKTTITSTGSFNDGQWHYFVASLGSGGMSLSVDSKQVAQNAAVTHGVNYQGWWRLGGDTLSGFANRPIERQLQRLARRRRDLLDAVDHRADREPLQRKWSDGGWLAPD